MFDLLMQSPLMVRAPAVADRTQPWDSATHRDLIQRCGDFTAYPDRGWFCIAGYEILRDETGREYDRNRILHVHFNSSAERDSVLAGLGLKTDGHSVYPMTPADRRARRAAVKIDPRYRVAWDRDDDAE